MDFINSKKTCVMGIINMTPDSFSDGGRYNNLKKGLEHVQGLISEGADILDIGGESTRPFSKPVPEEEELKRVIPILKEIKKISDIPVSVDTRKSSVARKSLENGALIINDVSSFSFDEKMAETIASFNAYAILTHIKGSPENMQVNPLYDDLMDEIKSYFKEKIKYALNKGLEEKKLIIDPGIGFGKTLNHNIEILSRLNELKKKFKLPVLIGTSRKNFIRKILEKETLPLDPDVITGSVASICAGIMNGADLVRVHDVKETKAAVKIIDALKK